MFDVKKVDAAIEHIAEKLSSHDLDTFEKFDAASKMTTALAELIKARAELDNSEKNEIIEIIAELINKGMSENSDKLLFF